MEVADLHLDFLPTEYSKKIWADRYLQSDNDDVFKRVAKVVASKETKLGLTRKEQEKEFLSLFENNLFIGGGRHLCNMGGTGNNMPGNCFVLPIEDSREGIYKTLFEMAEIESKGGGVGVNFSKLRPRNDIVHGSKGKSSGPCSFIDLYNVSISTISQGGCFSGSTLILTNYGLVRVDEIVNSNKEFLVYTHLGWKKVTSKFNNGINDIYKVTSEHGYTVEVTKNHKFQTYDKEGNFLLKELKDLTVGDNIVLLLGDISNTNYVDLNTNVEERHSIMSTTTKDITLPSVLDERLAYFIGVYLANGSNINNEYANNGKGVHLAIPDDRPELLNSIIKVTEDLFGETPKVGKGGGKLKIVSLFSVQLSDYLAINGFRKNGSINAFVPKSIFISPRSVIEAFIGGYFSCDGSNKGSKGGLTITSISYNLIIEMQRLLLSLGIPSRIHLSDRTLDGWNTLYSLSVNGKRYMKRYAEFLRKYTCKVFDKEISTKNRCFNWDFSIFNRFKSIKGLDRVVSNNSSSTSATVIEFLLDKVSNHNDREYLSVLSNCVPTKIESIIKIDNEDTYDLEVEDVHLLSGNGFYTSNSRRGALMALLDVNHPDIEEFIHAKEDNNRWTNLNISVAISDKFMDAVYRDAEWDLTFNDKVYKTVKANDLWNQICNSAAKSGEPGVIFIDTINRNSQLGGAIISATNPCFAGSNQLLTSNGRRSFESLVGKGIFYIISPNDNNEYPAKVEPAGIKRCIRLELSNGQILDLTPEHEIYTDDGKIEAQFALGKELVSDDEEVIVDNIIDIGEQEVYDFSEPVHHVGYVNGCVVSNCGELPLLPYGACNLGSLILPNFMGTNGVLNKDLLSHAVRMAVLYLDNLLDVSVWPLEKIKETVLDYRVLGIGVIGLADLLFLEGIPYGNNYKCIDYVRDLIAFIYNEARMTSEELAKELGPFPKYDKDKMKYAPRRNAQLMAMAPTGTISALYGASWGIEPYFSQTMIRDERIGKDVVSYQVLDKYMRNHDCLPNYARFAVGNTNLLSVDDHLAVLKVVANNIDNAVSKTVNLPKGSTSDDVDRVYKYMFDNNIKGGTVYVEGSRELEAVKVTDTSEDNMDDEDDIDDYIELVDLIAEPKPRPEAIEGVTYRVKYCYDKPSIYITINNFEEEPFEIFFSTKDSAIQEWLDMLARTITALFRRGISCDFLVKDFMQYSSSQCGGRFRGKYIQSASAAIGMVLKEHLRLLGLMPRDADEEGIRKMAKEDLYGLMCPECFERTLVKQGGCSSCLSCGFSKCE